MAKPKKEDPTAELMISIEQFTRTRDSVVVALTSLQNGLQHVQSGINDLLRAYMNHTASILAGESGALDSLQLTLASSSGGGEGASGSSAAPPTIPAATTAAAEGPKRKRKREKKERDPNAPKRPLTAAFLYGQHARPIVRNDLEKALGKDQKLEPNAVNLEVNRRWNEMADSDKELWRASYRRSMEEYKEAMKDYIARTGAPATLHDDEEASDEAEAGTLDTDAEASDDSGDEGLPTIASKVTSPPKKAATPPAKTPRPNKRQKTAATNGISAPVLAPAPPNPSSSGPSPVPVPITSKTSTTAVYPPGQTPVEAPTPASSKAKKDKSKKKDSVVAPPVDGVKEPSPEDGKKKKNRSTRQTDDTPVVVEKEEAAKDTKAKKRDRKRKSDAGV